MRNPLSILSLTLIWWMGTAGMASAQAPLRCDVNGDGVVNHVDVRTVMASVNKPATRGDPRDADRDGRITLADVRVCLQACRSDSCNGLNAVPVANAGPDQTAPVGSKIALNGAQSTDPDGPQPLSYSWTMVERPAGSNAALAGPNTVNPDFVIDRPGRYVMSLVVNDGLASSPADQVVISTSNSPPVANGGPDRSVFVGDWVMLNASASTDVDGDPLSFTWTLKSKPQDSAAALQFIRPRIDEGVLFLVDKEGTYAVELIASDGKSTSAPDIILITTGNTMPVANPKASCAALPNVDCSVPIATAVTVDGSASTDVDGDPLTYSWALLNRPAGSAATLSSATGVSTGFSTDAPGNFVVQLIVNDGHVNSVPKTVTVTSTNVKPAAVATINPISIAALPQLVQLDGSGSIDPEGQGLSYLWSLIAKPSGSAAALSSTTAQKPAFTADLVGTYTAQLIVNDGFLPSTPVTVSASTVNQPPIANAGPDQTLVAGSTVQLTSAGSSDPEGATLGYFWSMLNKPAGSAADFNNANAANPTFPADRKGTFVAQLIVNDGTLDSAPDTVQITATNRAPVAVADGFSVAQDGSLVVGAATGVLANDTDADSDTLTAILVGANPTGLSLNANGGFTYTPPAGFSGTTTFQYKANDGTVDSNTVTVTINVTPGLSTVTVAATTPNASEVGPVSGVFTFSRTGSTASPLNVGYSIGGTATNGTDYAGIGFAVTIPAGLSSTTVTIAPQADAIVEGNETVILTINPSAPDYVVGAQNSATVTIADVPAPVVTIAATTPNASEVGPVSGVFTFSRTGSTTFALNVGYSIGGTATNGTDYAGIGFAVTIPAGQSSTTQTITPQADAGVEGNETVILTINPSAADYVVGAQNSATVTIADAPAPVVTIAATTPNASEVGPVSGVFTFSRTGSTTFALNVGYAIGGTAVNGTDYAGIGFAVTIPAGQSSTTLTITPQADAIVEADETVILTINPSAADYVVGAQNSATVTIADGSVPTVTVVATDANASETGPDPGVFTFTRTGPTTFDLTVNFTGGGTATNFFDYQTIASSVVIPAGQASATVTITPVADALIEPAETVILTINASPATYLVGAPNSATVTIADGVSNTVTVVATDANASETGPDPGVFTFTRTGPTTFDLTVNFTGGGTATNFFDYQTIASSVVIPAGQASATVTITPVADALIEPAETVILTINASPATYLVGAPNSATVTIADGVSNTVTVVATDANASETGPDPGVFTFTRTGPTTFDLTVNFTGGGTATNFFDYQTIASSVVIPAGQASATVTITPVADALIEPAETVILTINASPATYLVGAPNSATVTIADGVSNTVTVVATDPNASETGPDSGLFTFTRTGPTTFDLTVNFTGGGTATNFFDYQTIASSVVIPAGQASATVTITPVADPLIEGSETVILTIDASPTTYLVGAPNSATVTIADGVPNTVTVVATDANASETGPDPGVFTFTRTGPTTFDLTVNFTGGGTATNFFDYQTIASSVVIPAGQTSATVTITPVADALIEPAETVILTINPSPTTYLVGAPNSATVTIADGVPNTVTVVATDPDATEATLDPGTFTFTRTGPLTFDVTVNFTGGGTATNFFDYQTIASSVVIPAGQASATVTITPVADGVNDPDETVILTINASPTTYLVGAQNVATVTIH